MEARRRDITAALDELEVRFLLDPETSFDTGLEPQPTNPELDLSAQPDPPSRR